MPKNRACVDCHFLVKTMRVSASKPVVQIVSATERTRVKQGEFDWVRDEVALSCYFGVWDEGLGLDVDRRAETMVDTDRRGFCFFWSHRPGMLLPAAKVLQEREARLREARRDRRLTLVGLWIAASALVANVLLTVLHARGWWPF